MDWLFACHENQQHPSPNNKMINQYEQYPSIRRLLPSNHNDRKKGGALLYHLRAMHSRESRQRGSGARMFIQACVLSGCDYCPNRLSGVGFITACKMIKENAHRKVDERFSRILNSFPKDKILADGDGDEMEMDHCETSSPYMKIEDVPQFIQGYETLLAKSEATFYYHKVSCVNSGQVVSLIEPLLQCDDDDEILTKDCRYSREAKKIDRFLPNIQRFNGDLSFTGHVNQTTYTSSTSSVPATERTLPAPSNPYKDTKKSFFVSQVRKRIKLDEDTNETKGISATRKNPNINLERQPSYKKRESCVSQKGGDFSTFTRGTSVSTNINCNRHEQRKKIETHSISSSAKVSKVLINVDDSDSDSDLLDEKNTLFSGRKKLSLISHSIITPNDKRQTQSTSHSASSLSTDSSTPKSTIRSKYFPFDNVKDDEIGQMSQSSTTRHTYIPFVTPKVSGKKKEAATIGSSPICNDKFLQDDESSNDCVIIDNPANSQRSDTSSKASSFLQKNSQTSLLEKFQSQYNPPSTAQRKSSYSPFSRAQFEGTRAKFRNSTTMKTAHKRKKSLNGGIRQQSKIPSIKGFFIPLKTAKENNR